MGIRYTYTNYPYSKTATKWNQLRNNPAGICLFLLVGVAINSILTSIISNSDAKMVISVYLSIGLYELSLFLARRRETVCASCDLEKSRLGRNLSNDEKKQILSLLKKASYNVNSSQKFH